MKIRQLLGQPASERLQKWLLPPIEWNQVTYGKLVLRHLRSTTQWLDVGCGWRVLGKDLDPMENLLLGSAGRVVGIDPEFASLSKHRNLKLRCVSHMKALPFSAGSFDLVTSNMVVEHLPDPRSAFADVARVLRPGGLFILHTPNLVNYAVFLNHTLGRWLPRDWVLRAIKQGERREAQDVFPTFYRANSARHLNALAKSVGLSVESLSALPPPQPFSRFFAPLALVQILLMRLMLTKPFRGYGATLLVAIRKP